MHFHIVSHPTKRTANYVFLASHRAQAYHINDMLHRHYEGFVSMINVNAVIALVVVATMIIVVMHFVVVVDIIMFVVAMTVHLTLP